jgi:hypothetical protein
MALAALVSCRSGGRPTNPVDPQLAAFLPADAELLAGARLTALQATRAGRKLAIAEWLEAADPGLDARELLAAWDGKAWLLAARGPRHGPPPASSASRAFAVPAKDVTLAGTPAAVRAALGRRGAAPAALLARAQSLPATSQIWAVSSGPVALAGLAEPALDRILRAVEDVTFTADLRSGLEASAAGNCLDEHNAQYLETALRGMLALARVPGLTVTHQGRSIRLEASLPEDALEAMIGKLTRGR